MTHSQNISYGTLTWGLTFLTKADSKIYKMGELSRFSAAQVLKWFNDHEVEAYAYEAMNSAETCNEENLESLWVTNILILDQILFE